MQTSQLRTHTFPSLGMLLLSSTRLGVVQQGRLSWTLRAIASQGGVPAWWAWVSSQRCRRERGECEEELQPATHVMVSRKTSTC